MHSNRFFFCVTRSADGVLRSGWGAPGSKELLPLSAVKAKLAALCMFGGPDSPSPENLTKSFLKHRENVSTFLQSLGRCYDVDEEIMRNRYSRTQTVRPLECGAERSMPPIVAASETASQSASPAPSDSTQYDHVDEAGGPDSKATYSQQEALSLTSCQHTVRLSEHTALLRVDIPTAHRCGHHTCICNTECVAVHEVEPALPHG